MAVVITACQQDGMSLEYASDNLKDDKDVVLEACQQQSNGGLAFRFASDRLKADKELVLIICRRYKGITALKYASKELQADKEVVLAACQQNGMALEYASDNLKADKDVVIVAASSAPNALKVAKGGLSQERDCLIAAKVWDSGSGTISTSSISLLDSVPKPLLLWNKLTSSSSSSKIVLSTRFSLEPNSQSQATMFAVLLKQNEIIQRNANQFAVYSPNAFAKDTCDPEWTNADWPCRGTYKTCRKEDPVLKRGVPKPNSCWRYSF